MCGIAGTIDADPSRAGHRVRSLNDRQRHRGPDHSVVRRAGSFTIGNARLAIQDPGSAGNQPFASADGSRLCVFNGEIYNYLELVARFGLELASRCDGAVIPELWSMFGPGCLALLRGMYAIALVDLEAGTLSLARDPLGIKPLYWRLPGDGTLVFGSEPRPLAGIAPRAELRSQAVARYLYLGALHSDESPFAGVEAVPPGGFLTLGHTCERLGGGLTAPPGPRPPPTREARRPRVAAADVAGTFRESVDLHLRSDVPTALLLSSGVDSGSIAAAAAERGSPLRCLTVAALGLADETDGARATATRYGHPLTVVPAELDAPTAAGFFAHMQRPTIDGLNTFLVCRAVREAGVKVALSGAGADEVLGGYSHYRLLGLLPLLRGMDRLPGTSAGVRRVGMALGGRASNRPNLDKAWRLVEPGGPRNGWDLSLLQREVLPARAVSELTGTIVDVPAPSLSYQERTSSYQERTREAGFALLVEAELAVYLQSMLLPDADAFSMAWSVELRVPFVDVPFFASARSAAATLGGRLDKGRFCAMLGDPFLCALARRPKRGFSVPMASWMRTGPLKGLVEAASDRAAPVWNWVDRGRGLQLLDVGPRWSETWSLTALNSWLESVATDPVLA